MSKYQCSTFRAEYELYKEDILGALRGVEINHESGEERQVTKEEAQSIIMSAFKAVVYQLVLYMEAGVAMDKTITDFIPSHDVGKFYERCLKYANEEHSKNFDGEWSDLL